MRLPTTGGEGRAVVRTVEADGSTGHRRQDLSERVAGRNAQKEPEGMRGEPVGSFAPASVPPGAVSSPLQAVLGSGLWDRVIQTQGLHRNRLRYQTPGSSQLCHTPPVPKPQPILGIVPRSLQLPQKAVIREAVSWPGRGPSWRPSRLPSAPGNPPMLSWVPAFSSGSGAL